MYMVLHTPPWRVTSDFYNLLAEEIGDKIFLFQFESQALNINRLNKSSCDWKFRLPGLSASFSTVRGNWPTQSTVHKLTCQAENW